MLILIQIDHKLYSQANIYELIQTQNSQIITDNYKSQLTIIFRQFTIPIIMLIAIRNIPRMTFFWKKTPKKPFIDELEQAVDSSANLSYMIKQIKTRNLNKPKILPPQELKYKDKLTVVLELDEVISYTFTPDQQGYLLAPLRKHDHYTDYEEYEACLSIYKRKNLDNFINYLAQECEPVLWSTGVPSYIEIVMNYLDPMKKIPYRIAQQHCDLIQDQKQQLDMYVKDLNLLGRDLSRVVYIDSKPLSYWVYPDNCYPIEEFKADMTMENEDLNLMLLQLESLKQSSDVRQTLFERFRVRDLLKQAKLL